MYASKRAGKDRVTGHAAEADGPPGDAGVASLRERSPVPPATGGHGLLDPCDPRRVEGARGRPDPDQRADLPDRDVRLGRRGRARPGRGRRSRRLRLQPHLEPDHRRARRGLCRAGRRRGGRRPRVGDGRDPRRALASLVRAGDRIVAPVAAYGSTRAPAPARVRRLRRRRSRSSTRPTTTPSRPRWRPARRGSLYAETIANPTTHRGRPRRPRRAGPPPRRPVRRRQHVRLAVRLPPARPRRGPRRRVGDQVPRRPQRRDRRRRRPARPT